MVGGFDLIDKQDEFEGKRSRVNLVTRMYKHTPKKLQIGVDNISSSSGMDNEVYTNYSSDELGSSDLDASYQEKEPKYPRFKM